MSFNETTSIYPYNMTLMEEYTTDSLSESYLLSIVHIAQLVLAGIVFLKYVFLGLFKKDQSYLKMMCILNIRHNHPRKMKSDKNCLGS
jgi:hypothetical protein